MKKVFIVLAILMLCITIFQIRITYAKYVSGLQANADFQVSPWKIKVNDTDITNESTFTSNIIWDASDSNAVYYKNVAQYKFAPTTLGTGILGYRLEIDTTALGSNTDVKFEIKVDMSNVEEELSKSNINVNDMFELNLKRNSKDDSFIVDYDDSSKLYNAICQDLSQDYLYFGYMHKETTQIDIFFRWIDDRNGKNDEIDTLIGTGSIDLEIPITVTVTQLDANT